MYKCQKCGLNYDLSEDNHKLICNANPREHIISCPHCKNATHIIGADFDDYMYGTPDKPAYLMYGRDKKQEDNLQIVEGVKI